MRPQTLPREAPADPTRRAGESSERRADRPRVLLSPRAAASGAVGPPPLASWEPALARAGDVLGFWAYLGVVTGPPVTPAAFGVWSLALPLSLAWLAGADAPGRAEADARPLIEADARRQAEADARWLAAAA